MNQIERIKYFAYDIPEVVKMYHYSGDFEGEIEAISNFLTHDNITTALKERLLLQKLTAEVLLHDYPLTPAEFIDLINSKQNKKVLSACDIGEILKFQNVDYILVKGEPRFRECQAINLITQHPEFFEENTECREFDNTLTDQIAANNGMKCKFTIHEEAEISEDAIKNGEMLRIWLPFPVANESQDASKIRLLKSSHPCEITGSDIRTVYFETFAKQGDIYSVDFEFENNCKYSDPERVRNSDDIVYEKTDEYLKYTSEEYPQMIFTPYLKKLAFEITTGLKTPAAKAFAIYKWISEKIQYSYIRDYLIIPNIPEFTAVNGYGDCGAMILLFITLCRISGIPARWQSGWIVTPDRVGPHDWCRFMLPEFGWLSADLSYGTYASRTGNTKRFMHYFCNVDPYRMTACDVFLSDLVPGKRLVRMDPYDNQTGEAEYADGSMNIFYDSWKFKAKVNG